MKLYHLLLICLSSLLGEILAKPEQVHISYGVKPTEMIVTWVTLDKTNSTASVEYGIKKLNETATGNSTIFIDGGLEKRQIFIHRVILTDLSPGINYLYHCGSGDDWSNMFYFKTMQEGNDWSPRFAVYGDLGYINAQSIPRLQEEVQKGDYDAILHVGDFAYDMHTDNARIGDAFMRKIEPLAAYVPYMTCVGNHEEAYNFSNYVNRFSMVDRNTGQINNHYFSFNVGPVHIISLSTEFYFYLNYGVSQIMEQYRWLEQDLIEASNPENRTQRPWIVTMGHRPMYCSDFDSCLLSDDIVRKGIPTLHVLGLEDLFYKYGVDLEFWAHEHNYERLFPVYDKKVFNGSAEFPYRDPKAPVHIITGSAGCQEKHRPFVPWTSAWSAFRSSDYGYTRMTVENFTHLHLEQISDDQAGKVVDDIWIEKNLHGFEAWSN